MATEQIKQAAEIFRKAKNAIVFTGAGISVESGIPCFRGEHGLWSRYDPIFLEENYFFSHPAESWPVIKEIFYDFYGQAKPSKAHEALAKMEAAGFIKSIITQNIDNLHQAAGSRKVVEFHGTLKTLTCVACGRQQKASEIDFKNMPPSCPVCGQVLKPDFIFFGQDIKNSVKQEAFALAEKADVVLVIGTTGEVMPACLVPLTAKRHGAVIVEINPEPSEFTKKITDVFLRGPAGAVMGELEKELFGN